MSEPAAGTPNRVSADAIRHALAPRDEAAAMIAPSPLNWRKRGEVPTLLGWYRALPEQLLRKQRQTLRRL